MIYRYIVHLNETSLAYHGDRAEDAYKAFCEPALQDVVVCATLRVSPIAITSEERAKLINARERVIRWEHPNYRTGSEKPPQEATKC